MVDVNLIMVGGRLTRDPEMKYSPNGIPMCNFTVATNRKFNKADGTKGESVVFVDVNTWRRLAELCGQFLKKGRSVLVIGKLHQSNWVDKAGQKRSKIRITADTVQFLGPKPEAGEGTGGGDAAAAPEEREEEATAE